MKALLFSVSVSLSHTCCLLCSDVAGISRDSEVSSVGFWPWRRKAKGTAERKVPDAAGLCFTQMQVCIGFILPLCYINNVISSHHMILG